ncbi:MAG: hypothetical protein ACT4QF_18835 [Sporichthyaceae bacterium]
MEREREARELRIEMLRLPTVPLRRRGFLTPADRTAYGVKPLKASVGPAGEAIAVWQSRLRPDRLQATTHGPSGNVVAAVEFDTDLTIRHVQPLPDGEVLLVSAETPPRGTTTLVVGADGAVRRTARWGRAIGEVLATPSGQIWAGYWDESAGSRFTGVVRFDGSLEPRWESRRSPGLPRVLDCYTLNVVGENACWATLSDDANCVLMAGDGESATVWGPAPVATPTRLLLGGAVGAVAGSWHPAMYDVATPFRLAGGVESGAPGCRIVLPNGLDASRMRWTCRGADLHAFDSDGTWYRLALADLLAGSDFPD